MGANTPFSAALVALSLASSLANAAPQLGPDLPVGVDADGWAQIHSSIVAHRHEFQTTGNGYEAANSRLGMTAQFNGDSAMIQPRSGEWQFGLALRSYGFEGQATAVERPVFGACASRQELSYDWSERLSEWWINDSRGFEHGFNVWERPESIEGAGSCGPLTFTLDVLGTLTPQVNDLRTGLILSGEDGKVELHYDGLIALDANGRTLDAWLKVAGSTMTIYVNESNAQYPIVVDPIIQQAFLKASNRDASDRFGRRVAASGDTVVVCAPNEESGATGVNGNEADNAAPDSGAAYVFVRSGEVWTQEAYLKASNTESGDRFGHSIAISGDVIVVGAIGEDSGATGVNGSEIDNSMSSAGAAYVFVRSGSTWIQEAYLKASNTGGGDEFGESVAVSGETVVVSTVREDSEATGVNGDDADNSAVDSGAAYVFTRTGGTWIQEAYLKASNTGATDVFGSAVAASEETVVVGAVGEDSAATGVNADEGDNSASASGAAYVFVRSSGTWSQQAYLKASNAESQDVFGRSIAVSGDTLVVGALGEDSQATGVNSDQSGNDLPNAGAAYVFQRSGSTWSQEAYLKASNTDPFDWFGWSVATSGDIVTVGAPNEDSTAREINGGEHNDFANASGAAYVFARSNGVWSQQAYLKASNADSEDEFGYSVAAAGATVVVGADGQGGLLPNSGAAYVFAGFVDPGVGDIVCIGTPNSTNFAGALTALGSPFVADNSLALEVTCCPPDTFGLMVTTSSNGAPIQSISVGEGVLCIGNPQIGRFPPTMTTATGTAFQVVDLSAIPTNAGPATAVPGDTYYFQFWHRDFIGSSSSNLTGAVSISLQ
jgi:hypothetical protein